MSLYFPIALSLLQLPCLVVGGGTVASRRIVSLLGAGADVTVVAPEVSKEIRVLVGEGRLRWIQESFDPKNLVGSRLVIAATDDPSTQTAIVQEARRLGILCNDAVTPEAGDFVVPSVVERGDLMISIVTGGSSPRLAAKLRQELADRYGPEYADYTALLREVRQTALKTIADSTSRRSMLTTLAEDDTILELIRAGRLEEAHDRAFSCISSSSD